MFLARRCICLFVDCGLCCHRQCAVNSSLPKCAAATAAAVEDDSNSQSQVHRLNLMPGEFFTTSVGI